MILLPLDNEKKENERFLAATYAQTIEDDAEEDVIWGKYVRWWGMVSDPSNLSVSGNWLE